MSLIGNIGSAIGSLAGKVYTAVKPYAGAIVGGVVGGPAGAMVGNTMMGGGGLPPLPGGGARGVPSAGFTGRGLSSQPMSTSQMVMTGGYSKSKISSINRAAGTMCARYPAWCLSVGGVGTVAQAMASGQLPIPRRRRRKGITSRDLSSFRRVANLIRHYSAPVHRMRHTTPRRKS